MLLMMMMTTNTITTIIIVVVVITVSVRIGLCRKLTGEGRPPLPPRSTSCTRRGVVACR